MTSLSRRAQTVVAVLAGMTIWVQGCSLSEFPEVGRIDLDSHAVIKAEDKTVGDILTAFQRGEAALHARDIDALMQLYAQDYRYRDLAKSDVRKIWEDLFAHYSQISSTHVFSKIVAEGSKPGSAEVTCTGRIWGTSKESGERVMLDSWFFEVHHLVAENGTWRVLGIPGEPPEVLGIPLTPHPFF